MPVSEVRAVLPVSLDRVIARGEIGPVTAEAQTRSVRRTLWARRPGFSLWSTPVWIAS